MLHVDVKKLGDMPDGGGWRYVGRRRGERNRAATPDKPRSKYRDPLMGKAFVHTVIDDHSRVAYAEIHDDETALTPRRSSLGLLSGSTPAASPSSGSCPTTVAPTAHTCGKLGIKHKRTRP